MTSEELLQTDLFCSGLSHVYQKWARGDYALSAHIAADLLYSMIPQSLKHSWFTDTDLWTKRGDSSACKK